VTVAAFVACGDDSNGPTNTAGTGGSAGASGSAGSAGSAGTAGAGGGSGSAGTSSGGSAGAAGSPAVTFPTANCTACVQLSVEIPATPTSATNGSQAGYIFSAPATAAPFDLTNVTTITWRVQALSSNANCFVQPVLQNAPPEDPNYSFGSYPATVPLTAAAFPPNTWVDVPMDVAAIGGGTGADAGVDAGDAGGGTADAGDAGDAGGGTAVLTAFDKSKTRTIGLNVGAGPTAGAGICSVEVDSVTVAGTSNFTTKTFDTGVDGLSLNMYMVPPGTLAPVAH